MCVCVCVIYIEWLIGKIQQDVKKIFFHTHTLYIYEMCAYVCMYVCICVCVCVYIIYI